VQADSPSIFLSYARLDNDPETSSKEETGWVDHFQFRLLKRLRQLGRDDVSFWRDVAEISDAERFTPKILEGLAKAKVFLPVASPAYVRRPWCKEELNRFASRVAQDPGIERRIVPVLKRPVDEVQLPPPLRGRHGYHFYRHDEVRKRVIEFFRCGHEEDPNGYREAIDSLAEYICSVLPTTEPLPTIANPPGGEGVITVFVADPAEDMFAAYDRIVGELKLRGFRVVTDPSLELPTDVASADAILADALDQAWLLVHLLGNSPGPRIGGSRLVDLQLMRTFERKTARVIWAPTTLFDDPTHPDSAVREHGRDPLAKLQDFGDFRDGDTVLGDPLEAFLCDLIRRCEAMKPAAARPPFFPGAEGARVYVVGAAEDAHLVDDVTGTLIDAHGLDACPSVFEGPPDEIRRLHENEMREADAIVYCWGTATDAWLRSYTREARFVARLGRDRPFRATALFKGPPLQGRKLTFRSGDVSLVLPPAEKVIPELFLPFVQALGGEATV
jgi:hypothetical protein